MVLSELAVGEQASVVGVTPGLREQRRLTELGLRPGASVQLVRRAPLGGPLAVRIGGGLLALRVDDARHIEVEPGG